MRAIKVRAWSNDHHKYCDFVTLDVNGRWTGWIKVCGVFLSTTDIILEQDTGLKDKNGESIWEGDIVEGTMGVFEVKWCNTDSRFGFKSNMAMDWHPSFVRNQANKMEIVGNIHKNPELLKEEK